MNSDQREKIMSRVKAWLDDFGEPESLPEDFPREEVEAFPQPDLFSVVAAMTGVSEELRLQGKSFKRLADEIGKRLETPAVSASPLAPAPPAKSVGEILEQGREEGRCEGFQEMIALHDRLTRILEDAQRQVAGTGIFTALFGQAELQHSMAEGLRLVLSRFQDFLDKHEISQFGQLGEDFDPVCMKAVDAMATPNLPAGKILGIIHFGYHRRGKILKYAEVLVSK